MTSTSDRNRQRKREDKRRSRERQRNGFRFASVWVNEAALERLAEAGLVTQWIADIDDPVTLGREVAKALKKVAETVSTKRSE